MKKIIKTVIIVAILSIVIQIETKFKNRDIFNISKVSIFGASETLKDDISKIEQVILHKNINDLDLNELKKRILKDIRVKDVIITSKNMDEIVIEVKEKKFNYYLQYKGQIYVINDEGEIFGRLDEYFRKIIPILIIKNDTEITDLLDILQTIKEIDLQDEISQIYVVNKNLVEIILKSGTKIKTKKNVSKHKYKIMFNLYQGINKEKKIEYIDVRFNDIILKEKEGKSER